MRMFQSVSGHSSEQSTAHYSSRPTVSQLNGVSDTISNWFDITDHRGHKFPPSLRLLSVQNSNRMAFRLTAFASFPAALITIYICLDYSSIFWKICRFAVQFLLRCKFAFHEKRSSSQVWQWRDFPGPITIHCYAYQPMRLLHFA